MTPGHGSEGKLLHPIWTILREHVTHWVVGGAILMATGFTPEDWLVRLIERLHLSHSLLHMGSAGLDARVLLVAAGLAAILADVLWRRRSTKNTQAANLAPLAQQTLVVPTPSAAPAPTIDRMSIAVLPFANMSGDATQEFFSDGITEEITAALTKIPELQVVGRTSAFQFKGRGEDLRSVGLTLRAAYLIEGSVRKAGERLRITAQLIRAESGTNIWAETYERRLTDIFAVQEEIAKSIAGSLRVPLQLPVNTQIVFNRTDDLPMYERYLRALGMVRERRDLDQAIGLLEEAVAGNAQYAPAWALLGFARSLQPYFSPAVRASIQNQPAQQVRPLVQSIRGQAEAAANRAIELDARLALGHATRATVHFWEGDWGSAAGLYQHALDLDPDDPDIAIEQGIMFASLGFLDRSLAIAQRVRQLEPLVHTFGTFTAMFLQLTGQNSASLSILEAMPRETSINYRRSYLLAKAYAAEERFADAVTALREIDDGGPVDRKSVDCAIGILSTAPQRAAAPDLLPTLNNELNFVYGYVGTPERMLEFYEYLQTNGLVASAAGIWDPLLAPMRKTERFKNYLRTAGVAGYWREHAWPAGCRPLGNDDFDCG